MIAAVYTHILYCYTQHKSVPYVDAVHYKDDGIVTALVPLWLGSISFLLPH